MNPKIPLFRLADSQYGRGARRGEESNWRRRNGKRRSTVRCRPISPSLNVPVLTLAPSGTHANFNINRRLFLFIGDAVPWGPCWRFPARGAAACAWSGNFGRSPYSSKSAAFAWAGRPLRAGSRWVSCWVRGPREKWAGRRPAGRYPLRDGGGGGDDDVRDVRLLPNWGPGRLSFRRCCPGRPSRNQTSNWPKTNWNRIHAAPAKQNFTLENDTHTHCLWRVNEKNKNKQQQMGGV